MIENSISLEGYTNIITGGTYILFINCVNSLGFKKQAGRMVGEGLRKKTV